MPTARPARLGPIARAALVGQLLRRAGRSRHGFSLVELMIVMTIIGILASIGLPGYKMARDRAAIAGLQSNVRTVQRYVEEFISTHNGLAPNNSGWLLPAYNGPSDPSLREAGILRSAGLPENGWSDPQTQTILPPVGMRLTDMLPGQTVTMRLNQDLGPGTARPTGPSLATDFGAVLYDSENDGYSPTLNKGGTYIMFGTGKHKEHAVIVATASNSK